MASRKEEKERLRKERIEAEQKSSAAARKRLIMGYAVAGLLGVIVLAGIVVAIASSGGDDGGGGSGTNVNTRFGTLPPDLTVDNREGTEPPPVANADLAGASREANCDLQLDLPDEGNTHFSNVDKVVKYDTNPPTSGDHYAANEAGSGQLADGAFTETPNWNRLVHSLEHGRVEVQYDPDLSEEEQLELKGVFDEDRPGVDFFPNADMPYAVAATAWTQLVGCKTYDGAKTLDVIRDFRDAYRGQGPEQGIPYLPYG